MSYYMFCTNKGCHKEMEPVLDLETDKCYCSQCSNEVEINHFTKTTLRTLGQIKRAPEIKDSLSLTCEKCKHQARPKVSKDKLLCQKCEQEFNLHPIKARGMIQMLGSSTGFNPTM